MPRTAPAPNMIAIPGMNPGIIVAGGGGAGGGSGAGGGGGKGGKKGADGSDGEHDPDGGENGSGACGTGGAGSCTNCSSNLAAGDPVDVLTGKAFTIPKTDLFLPGAFNLDFRRSYSSERSHVDAGIGHGWTHSLAWSLEQKHHSAIIRTGDGRRVEMAQLEVGEMVQNGAWGLMRHKDFYLLRPGNEFMHYFGKTENPKVYRLEFIRYRNRGFLSLHYENGLLSSVIDSVGRVILFRPGPSGRIESLLVPDDRGHALVFATYAYDSEGNLVAVADADGHITRYAYDDRHLLTRLEYPNGLTFHFRYDGEKRCIETWGAYPNGVDPALDPAVTKQLIDGSPAKGIFHNKLEFTPDDYSEVIDSVRLRRFFLGPGGHIAKAVDPLGGVTSREFDELGRIISVTDPTDATWRYAYDDLDAVVRETDPEGNVVEILRDSGAREIGLVDGEGGRVELERDWDGETTSIRLQNGAFQQYQVGALGRTMERVDERGARHLYEYDTHGNLTAYVSPLGARYEFTYDYWGRRLSGKDPLGNVTTLRYQSSGLVSQREDALGRQTHYYYDSMGNLVQEVGPDGAVQSFQYSGLNWLYSELRPDRTEVRTWYNREGWPTKIENEAGEIYEFEYDASGLVTREKDFLGRVTKYGYDARGRLAWYDEGEGKFEIERNKVGAVIKRAAPDGSAADFRFNRRGELIAASRDGVGFLWERDPIGGIVSEHIAADELTYSVETEREPGGERLRTRSSLGYDVQFRRDPEGRVIQMRTPTERLLEVERDLLGSPVRRQMSGGAAIADSYDPLYRLKTRELEPPRPGTMRSDLWDSSPRERFGQTFDYSTSDELIAVASSDGETTLLEYDLRRRLKRRERRKLIEEFRADAQDNYYEVTPDVPRIYGPGSQLTRRGDYAFRYNRRGFLLEKSLVDSIGQPLETTRFEWDAWGLLRAVVQPDQTRIEFAYDPFARRIGKTILTKDGAILERHRYVWDLVAMVHDIELDANGEELRKRTYSYLDPETGVPFAQKDGSQDESHGDAWSYYFTDLKGLPEKIVDGSGQILTTYEHSAFGKATATGTTLTPFRAPGQQEDPETGLFYNRYRYYDPDLGRFISPDPIGLDGGLNTYSYGPNPIGWADPMGWKHTCIVLGSEGTNETLLSGYHDLDDDHAMRNQPRAHTEQKFMHELLSREGALNGRLKGETFNLLGEMPPCPRCHASMMRASKETGADVNYKWKDENGDVQTISYKGGSGTPTATGEKAEKLLGAYPKKLSDKEWEFHQNEDPSERSANDYWGVEPEKGAEQAYFDMASSKSPKQDVHSPEGEDPYWSDEEIEANKPPKKPSGGGSRKRKR